MADSGYRLMRSPPDVTQRLDGWSVCAERGGKLVYHFERMADAVRFIENRIQAGQSYAVVCDRPNGKGFRREETFVVVSAKRPNKAG